MWKKTFVVLVFKGLQAKLPCVEKYRKKTILYCHKCSSNCYRHGKRQNKQRWRCKNCGLTQFRIYKKPIIETNKLIALKRLNRENVGIRGIGRLLGMSPTQVIRLFIQLAGMVKRPVYREYGQEYELDELWSYAGNKKQECWIIWAINRKTREIIDFVVGARTKENILKLVNKLKPLYPKCIRTDRWSGYEGVFKAFPSGIHKPGRRITNRIERQGATLRVV